MRGCTPPSKNQVAAGNPIEARQTLERLIDAGLGRHEAIHAVASVLLEEMVPSVREGRAFSNETYRAALKALTVESWRRTAAAQDSED